MGDDPRHPAKSAGLIQNLVDLGISCDVMPRLDRGIQDFHAGWIPRSSRGMTGYCGLTGACTGMTRTFSVRTVSWEVPAYTGMT